MRRGALNRWKGRKRDGVRVIAVQEAIDFRTRHREIKLREENYAEIKKGAI